MDKKVGEQIAALRQAAGKTQEELAHAVGVSAQAVSKWECGGLPDAALLPGIADCLGVPIDRLFGRRGGGNIGDALRYRFTGMNQSGRMQEAMGLCFELQKALGCAVTDDRTLAQAREQMLNENSQTQSQMLYDSGFSLMSLPETLPYFMLLPEPPEGWEAGLCPAEEYAALFGALAQQHVMQTLFFLLRRAVGRPFTPKLLEQALDISAEQSAKALETLTRYQLVSKAELELDDAVQTIYTVEANPALLAMLAVGKEVARKPTSFFYYSNGRTKPMF